MTYHPIATNGRSNNNVQLKTGVDGRQEYIFTPVQIKTSSGTHLQVEDLDTVLCPITALVYQKLLNKSNFYLKSLFFVQCPVEWLIAFKQRHFSDFMIYTDKPGGKPAPVRNEEMEMFIMVTSAHNNNAQDIEVLEPKPQYAKGDLVRVTDGFYKGATGIVKRIRKDRKLLVAISGVAVVAISHIPMCFLEKV